ncbi:MAG TPA: hypothetical protein ENI51_03445 [Candidatus Atribacteria bacterium]|nr:hypothetical protein [Candidatus Atribacteria bacterium]
MRHYIYSNQGRINAVDRLRARGLPVEDLGAVEGNIDKSLANSLPILSGPHQDRPWVKSSKRLVSIDY